MNTKFQKSIPYLGILLISLLFTFWYTGDLEMGWLLIELLVPVLSVIVGIITMLIFKRNLCKVEKFLIIAFSFILNVGLLLEEMFIGFIRIYLK